MRTTAIKEKLIFQLFTIYLRFLIGGTFVFASIIKIKGKRFTTESGENSAIDSAWHLFEVLYQSGLYWQFLGVVQLIAGGLLMTQKYAKLGAVIFLPISVNIFVITLSYEFNLTAIISGGLVVANLYLLIWEWNTLKLLLGLPPERRDTKRLENDSVWVHVGTLLFLFTSGYRVLVDRYDVIFWMSICICIGALGLIPGLLRMKKYPTIAQQSKFQKEV